MCRRNFNRTRTLFRIGMIIGNNRNHAIGNRQNTILADKVLELRIIFGNSHCRIAKHGFRTSGGNMDKFILIIFQRIFVVIHFADGFFLKHFQIRNGCFECRIPVYELFGFINQAVFIQRYKNFAYGTGKTFVHGKTLAAPIT